MKQVTIHRTPSGHYRAILGDQYGQYSGTQAVREYREAVELGTILAQIEYATISSAEIFDDDAE